VTLREKINQKIGVFMRKNRGGTIIILSLLVAILGGILFLYQSPLFERNPPKITLDESIHWNLKDPIPLHVKDESGVKFLRVSMSDGTNSVNIINEVYDGKQLEVNASIEYPRTGFLSQSKNLTLQVEVTDGSKWNLFAGNQSKAVARIYPDNKRPTVFVLTNSYKITKGGTALVAFKADDENLNSLYIETNSGQRFYPTPFYKDGYYVSLVAWPRPDEKFSADIIATDKAGNFARERIRFFLQDRKYRVSTIELSEGFLGGKVTNLAQMYSRDYDKMKPIERFMFVNQTLRNENNANITKAATTPPKALLSEKKLTPFYPLRNGAAVASFGDYRKYSYNGTIVSESYHLGLDLASTAQADIVSTNDGKVVYANENGIYGQSVIIDHGLGLFTLYSHCSSLAVREGDEVKAGDVIAKTGSTGFAFGDHLHFGVLVQGIDVRPEEWMDAPWMNDNIYTVLENAKSLIDRHEL
jgi:murein DD-endopeptidase MepM/ murein hydrolase activator NlpD